MKSALSVKPLVVPNAIKILGTTKQKDGHLEGGRYISSVLRQCYFTTLYERLLCNPPTLSITVICPHL